MVESLVSLSLVVLEGIARLVWIWLIESLAIFLSSRSRWSGWMVWFELGYWTFSCNYYLIREFSIKVYNIGYYEEAILLCKIKGKVKIDILGKKRLAKLTDERMVDMLCLAPRLWANRCRQATLWPIRAGQGHSKLCHGRAGQASQSGLSRLV